MKRLSVTHLNNLLFISFSFLLVLTISCNNDSEKDIDELLPLEVIFSHEGGTYDEEILLELTCSEVNSQIWYTVDGMSEPEMDGEGSTLYDDPISIRQTITVKARAYSEDLEGRVYSETYTFTTPVSIGFFAYYPGSFFEYIVKKKSTATEGDRLIWEVESFDEETGIATVSATTNGSEQSMIYFKNSVDGLEYSSDGTKWKYLVCSDASKDLGFIYVPKAAKPSSLLGSVVNDTRESSVTTPAGTFPVFMHSSVYDNSSNDAYTYSDDNIEYYHQEIGFIKSYSHAYDGSSYPPWVYHREIELVGYYIIRPDGSILQGGKEYDLDSPPSAPTGLIGERTSTTAIELKWEDNSLNEDEFILERTGTKPNGTVSFPKEISLPKNTVTYVDSEIVETDKYTYRIKAINNLGESEFSEECKVNTYGAPIPPWDLTINYNRNLYYIFILCWAKYSDNIDHFKVAYYYNDNWIDLESEFESRPDDVYNDKWLQTLYLYYNGGQPFPPGSYRFKVKAVNAYGESFYSEEVEIVL